MGEKTPGIVAAVSKNKAALAVSNDKGCTVVELIGREGEIAVGDTVLPSWETGRRSQARNSYSTVRL